MSEKESSLPAEARPDFYLGTSETAPEHWGGPPRRCWVINRPRVKSGRELWRVRVDPPIPRYHEDGVSISERTSEWILAERYVGERIEDLSPGHNLSVNIWSYNDPRAPKKIAFDDVDLTLEYLGEVAFTADALPEPRDPTKA